MTDDTEDIEDVYSSFYEDGMTDGLPVIPPTEDRVDEMLRGATEPPDTELAELGDRRGILTVEKLAVNGVMAGCLPIHMPVLIAGARALADPYSATIEATVGTDSSAYNFLINGPIRSDLDINSDTGAFGPGFRSNATVSRALGLAVKNTANMHPGEKVMGVLGNPAKYQLLAGENEAKSPWEPFHVERGFKPAESTITLSNTNCFIQAFPPRSEPRAILKNLVDNTPPQIGFRPGAIYVINPANAQDLSGLSKTEIKEFIYENTYVEADSLFRAHVSSYKPDEQEDTGEGDGKLPAITERLFSTPEQVHVVVAGGMGRWNGIIGPLEGGPTTKEIELPDNWTELRERYTGDLARNWGK
jgi:hypothetical protein